MDNMIFIIGAGRSGTTWLHLMLGSHEKIATGQESQLFNNYLSHLITQWKSELNYPKTSKVRFHGISSYIDENEFYQLLTNFSDGVFSNALKAKKTATYLLEKSPNNSLHVKEIYRCYPNAKFIHLIRDGRDVTASILAAKKSWGKAWHHRTAEDAINEWQSLLSASREVSELTENYIEVRYEDLLTDGTNQLKRIFEFLEIDATEPALQEMYDSHAFSKLKKNDYKKDTFLNTGITQASGTDSRHEPKEFFRKGIAGDWKISLSKKQISEVEWVAGDLLNQLGYSCDKPNAKPFHMKLRRLKSALRSSISTMIHRFK